MSLTFIDFFAGIGGFRLGMEEASHKCIGYVEWDKFARKSYEAIHNTRGNGQNMTLTTLNQEQYQKQTCGLSDFRVPIFQSHQEGLQDLQEQDLDYFTKRLTSSKAKKKKIDLNTCSLKTLKPLFS